MRAVDGRALGPGDAARLRVFKANKRGGFEYPAGHVGAALSHLEAWRAVAAAAPRVERALVLEDDCRFAVDDFATAWAAPYAAALDLGMLPSFDVSARPSPRRSAPLARRLPLSLSPSLSLSLARARARRRERGARALPVAHAPRRSRSASRALRVARAPRRARSARSCCTSAAAQSRAARATARGSAASRRSCAPCGASCASCSRTRT